MQVSQRTHKCQAQPPGTVVRQTGDLVEKLKKKHTDPENLYTKQKNYECQNHYIEISEANAELARTGAKLSLEDMETESFTIFAETFNDDSESQRSCTDILGESAAFSPNSNQIFGTNIEELINTNSADDKSAPSPSDILRNLCLSKDDDYNLGEENGSDDVIKDFSDYL